MFLFSRCSDKSQVLGLFEVFEWPVLYLPGTSIQCVQSIGRWCIEGTFLHRVKILIRIERGGHFDVDPADLDLAFIAEHEANFKVGPTQLTAVGNNEQDAWLDQAKACILSKSPHDSNLDGVNTSDWFARQEAYFAFGVLSWNIRQDPGWASEDPRLDVWYKLGFSIATRQEPADELLAQYEKHFSSERVEFEYFFHYWALGQLAEQLQVGLKSQHSIFWDHFTKFHKGKITEEQDTVFRLYQAVTLRDDTYIEMMRTEH